ncbi:hypothetical protein [Actinoallomurus iriomotensis]|nr:hypothetical protein [Actinoallomurus iriomotensis]
MLPPDLASIFAAVAGMEWPEANEDDLRAAGDDYQAIADDIPQLKEYIVELVNVCLQKFEGEAADAFVSSMRELIGQTGGTDYLGKAADVATELAKTAHDTANEVEYTKWMVIAQLVLLVAEIAYDIFWAPFTFGESLVNITWQWALVRETIQIIFKWLLKSITMHTFASIGESLLMDATIQGIQFAQGHRHEWDKKATLQSLEFGVIGGVLSGPLDLIGMGLGKVLGGIIGKSPGRILAHELGDAMKGAGHILEDTVGDSIKHATGTVVKDVAGDSIEHATGKATKDLVDDALKHTTETGVKDAAGKWPAGKGAAAFARDLGDVMGAALPQIQQGFTKFGKGTIAQAFEDRVAKIFGKHLGPVLGDETAGQLGREFGATFTREWRSLDTDLSAELRDVLSHAPLSDTGVKALADALPELAAHMHEGNRLFQVGHAIGEQLKEGVHNVLSEGFYNMIFTDGHQFSSTWQTFGAGVAMGLLGRIGHHVASPISAKYAAWVSNWQHAPIHEGDSKYFGPLHPLTLMSLASNLAGHPAPFPVPRLGPHVAGPKTSSDGALPDGSPRAHRDEEKEPLLGPSRVRTESGDTASIDDTASYDGSRISLSSDDGSAAYDGPFTGGGPVSREGPASRDDLAAPEPVRTQSGEPPATAETHPWPTSAQDTTHAGTTHADPGTGAATPVRTHHDGPPVPTPAASPASPGDHETPFHSTRVDLSSGTWFPRAHSTRTHETAARAVPGADGWHLVVGHGAPGKVEIGGRLAGAAEALAHVGTESKLTFVTCYAARPGDDGVALALDAHLRTGQETLGPTHEAIVTTGGDVISGVFGVDGNGRQVVIPKGDWVVFRDGKAHALGTTSLKEAYARLNAKESPVGPAPAEDVGLAHGVSAAQRKGLEKYGYAPLREHATDSADSFYTSLLAMTTPQLAGFYGRRPTPDMIRQSLHDGLREDLGGPEPRYARFLAEGQRVDRLLAGVMDPAAWTSQLAEILPHVAADVFKLDLGVVGGDGRPHISGQILGPHRKGHPDGNPFLFVRVGGDHFVATQRTHGDGPASTVPRPEEIHGLGQDGGQGGGAFTRPLTSDEHDLVEQAGRDAVRHPQIEVYSTLAHALGVTEYLGARLRGQDDGLGDLIQRALRNEPGAADELDTLERIVAEHRKATLEPGPLNEAAHVDRVRTASDATGTPLPGHAAVDAARAGAYHALRDRLGDAVGGPPDSRRGIRAALSRVEAAGRAARQDAIAEARRRVSPPHNIDHAPEEAKQAAVARYRRLMDEAERSAIAPGGAADRAEHEAREREIARRLKSYRADDEEFDRLRWARLMRTGPHVIEQADRAGFAAARETRQAIKDQASTAAEWNLRTDAVRHEQLTADPPRELPPGFGEVGAGGERHYPLGHRGRVMRLGDAWFGDDAAISRLVGGGLPQGTGQALHDAVKAAVEERLRSLGNRVVAQHMLEGGLRLRVTVDGQRYEVKAVLDLGDFGQAHYLPAVESQRNPTGPASQSVLPGQRHHGAVESDHENIAGHRVGGANTRSANLTWNLTTPFGMPPNKVMSATVEVSVGGESSTSWAQGSDAVAATKRLFELSGDESHFEFPGARLTVELKNLDQQGALRPVHVPVPARLGFPKDLTPRQPPGGGPVRPVHPAQPGADGWYHGVQPARLDHGGDAIRDTVKRVDRVLSKITHLPQSISGLGGLREEVIRRLPNHSVDVGSELYEGIQHWISETNLLRNYGDLTTIGTLSPAYRTGDGDASAHLTVTSTMLGAKRIGPGPVPMKEEAQRWINTGGTSENSGAIGITPVKANFGYTIGDPTAPFGFNHSLGFGFSVGARLSTTRTSNANIGAGEVRGLVYDGPSVLYQLTTRMSVEVTSDMKGFANGRGPLAARDVTTFVRVPIHEAKRFEALVEREMAGPKGSDAWQRANALVPADQDPRPDDQKARNDLEAAEASPRHPPESMASGQGIGFSAVGRLGGAEAVLPQIEAVLKKVEHARDWVPDWSPMELKFLRRLLLPKFGKEALVNGGSGLFQRGIKDRLYRPVDNGTEVITIEVKVDRDPLPAASGRLSHTKLELMPAGFAGASGGDSLSSSVSGTANAGVTVGVGDRTGDELRQVSLSAEGGVSSGRSASTSVGASGFQIQAMLYNGPARTFDYVVRYSVTVSIRHIPSPVPGDLPKVLFRHLKNIRRASDHEPEDIYPANVPGAQASMVARLSGAKDDEYTVRFVVPEGLSPTDPAANPDAGRLTRPYDYTVPPPTPGNHAGGGKATVRLPDLPQPIQRNHKPLNGDDIVMETIGSHHVETEVERLLREVGIDPDKAGDITWTTTGTEMLTGANVRGPSPVTATLIKQGIIKDAHTVVRIEGYPIGSRPTPQGLKTLKMDVAEGGSNVSGSHGSSKDSSYKVNVGFGVLSGTSGGTQQNFPGISRGGDIPGVPRSSEARTTALSPTSGRLIQIQDNFTEHVADLAYVITVVNQKTNMFESDTPKVAASIIQITDGIHYLRSTTPQVDPHAPHIRSAANPAPGGKPTVIRARQPHGTTVPGAPRWRRSDKIVPRFPATQADAQKITRGEQGRTLPVDGLLHHAAASERLLVPSGDNLRHAGITGDGNPVLDGVQRVLQKNAPKSLEDYWQVFGADEAQQPLPAKLSSLLNVGSAEALIDTMLGPGLILHTSRSSVLHNERVWLLLRAHRDPNGKGYYFVESKPNANVARYHFRQNRGETGQGRPRGVEWSSSTKTNEAPSNAGRADSAAVTPGGSVSRSTNTGRSTAQIDASRNTLFVGGGADRYAGELRLDISLVRTPNPSRTLNTVLFTLPDKVSMLTHGRLDMTKVDGHESIMLTERVLIPPSLLKPDIQPYDPAGGHVAVTEVPYNSTVADLGGQALPITKQQLLDRSVFTLGFDHDKLQVLSDEVLKRLGKSPDNPAYDAATGRMASHGTRARDALYTLLSHPMLTNELELMLGEHGLVSPPLVREGGPFTDTHAKVTIKAELFDPRVANYFDGSLESNTYHFTESNESRSHGDGWGVNSSSGLTGVSGSTDKQPPGSHATQKPSGTVNVGGKQTTSRSSTVVHKQMPRTVSRGRTESWLRVKTDVLLKITIEARNQRGPLDFPGGTSEMAFHVRNGVELAFGSELALKTFDVPELHAHGIPTPSGVFVPARNFPGVPDDGMRRLQAALSFPAVGGATVIHVHGDPARPGNFVVGSRSLTPQEFDRQVLSRHDLGPGRYLVIVGNDISNPIGDGPSAAQIIGAAHPGLQIIGADGPVLTTYGGAVLTGKFTHDGLQPRAISWQGEWVLIPADGGPPVPLGPDLIGALQALGPGMTITPPRDVLPPPGPSYWSGSPGPGQGSGGGAPLPGGTSITLPYLSWGGYRGGPSGRA